MEIGLFYGLNALPSANLQNATGYGHGYSLGFFDQTTRQFFSLYDTDEIYLTILKDKPMWVTSGKVYYDVQPSSFAYSIGCYHLQAPESYAAVNTAAQAAKTWNDSGYKAFPAYIDGVFKVRIGEYLTQTDAEAAAKTVQNATGKALTVCGCSATCYTVTVTGSDKILFEFDSFGAPFGIQPKPQNNIKSQTWFKGFQYFGGFEYQRMNGGNLTVSNIVTLNDYIKGVIPYEMLPSWPIEALKAQALCAKSYALTNMKKHRSQGFDLCNTDDCQVYNGVSQANDTTNRAVDETNGYYITYQGEIAQTYYHSTSGGATENSENIWSGVIPYLRGVKDTYLVVTNPYSFTVTKEELTAIMKEKNLTDENIVDYYVSKYSEMGNVIEVTFVTQSGKKLVYTKEKTRTVLNGSSYKDVYIQSHRYTVSSVLGLFVDGANELTTSLPNIFAVGGSGVKKLGQSYTNVSVITGSGKEVIDPSSVYFEVNGTGKGHNVGMSQWGAHAMAQKGFTYDKIIQFYFTGVDITKAGGGAN